MKQRPAGRLSSSEKIIRDIKRRIAMDDDAPVWNEGDFIGEKFGQN